MRAEPPVQRLAGLGRPRGRLLPHPGQDDPGGWTPDPDDLPRARAAEDHRSVGRLPVAGDPDGDRNGGPVGLSNGGLNDGLPGDPPCDLLGDLSGDLSGDRAVGRGGGPRTSGEGGGDRLGVLRDTLADRVPGGWRGGRPVPYRAVVTGAALAVVMVVGLLAHRLSSPPTVMTVPGASSASAGAPGTVPGTAGTGPATLTMGSAPAGAAQGPAGAIVVDVEGKVRRPGLVRLPGGARVADAVQAAGGSTAEAALIRINLARPLVDGEQVIVPGPHDPLPPGANGPAATGAATNPGAATAAGAIDLNTATEAQLDALPGVGPVLAGRIVQWRTEHGRFTNIDQLSEVKGIGDALLTKLRPLVRV